MKQDIQSKSDLKRLFELFYERVLVDEQLKPHFKDFDLEHHLPRMVDFWSLLLLEIPGYNANVIEKHQHMNLCLEDFEAWEREFLTTLDDLYAGEKVRLAKEKLKVLRWTMEAKSL